MYIFNKITVNPQLPKRVGELLDIANNLWWSWNSEFLRLFKEIDSDLWETVGKNPVKFLKLVSQDKLEDIAKDEEFLAKYDEVVNHFNSYMQTKETWFSKNYPNNANDLIAYFSAEYGIDEIIPIYSGGLGILSGDHLKSASDLGLPFVAVGLLYKNGYFNQKIDGYGTQKTEYTNIDLDNLPILPVKDENGEDLIIDVDFPDRKLYLKIWKIVVGRISLYLMDSDIDKNIAEDRVVTLRLYGGDQEMRIRQEIVLGMAGIKLLRRLGLKPSVYHMNEGHSAFLTLEVIKDVMEEKQVSFEVAKSMCSAKTVFTTHTPVPAGNDIFPIELMDKYFSNFWPKLGISREDFLRLGMKNTQGLEQGFNMGMLALRIAGKKNGVSKLHGAVSRRLFSDVWPNIAPDESPIEYVTNGIHTCSWLAPSMKKLFNQYLKPYWQDNIQDDETWNDIKNIPNKELWDTHTDRKKKLCALVKNNITTRLKSSGYNYEEINEILTQLLNNPERPVQLIFAGKAHPADKEGQDLIKYIHEVSMKPQFKGKIFLLENYNIAMSRYLISGVDVWLNNPRRPMEASGTSGQKASVNGVINFSVLDGWWAEGYNQKNGWTIGDNTEYQSYEEQDIADSESLYNTLENKIIPLYYENKKEDGVSDKWMEMFKNSIISTGGRYSTSRMVIDYTRDYYMELANLSKNHYQNLDEVIDFTNWKKNMYASWKDIKITQNNNLDNITIDAGNQIEVHCIVNLPENIDCNSIRTEVYYGKILENGIMEQIQTVPMNLIEQDDENRTYKYSAKIELKTGGNYGYTFRVMPQTAMMLDTANLDLIQWVTR